MAAQSTSPNLSTRTRCVDADALGQLGPWQLVRQVAEGNLCRVYQARPADGMASRPAAYAVKVLLERWQDDSAAIELLRREATVGRQVSHAHLISVLAAHVGGPPYFVVMPWLNGSTLAGSLVAGHRPPLPVALWLARQTAEALGALHAAGRLAEPSAGRAW
jgi:eukaryotic-like serine/threonine-protein kinase